MAVHQTVAAAPAAASRPKSAEPAAIALQEHPAGGEDQRRDIGDQRHGPLARQPGGAPLADRAPRALRMPEMESRGEQAEGHRAQRQRQRREAEPALGRDQAQGPDEPQQEQEPVSGARGGAEQDDRRRRVHGWFSSPPSFAKPAPSLKPGLARSTGCRGGHREINAEPRCALMPGEVTGYIPAWP